MTLTATQDVAATQVRSRFDYGNALSDAIDELRLPTRWLEQGPISQTRLTLPSAGLGLVIAEGFAVRSMLHDDMRATLLFGPGDLLPLAFVLGRQTTWRALAPVGVRFLDERFSVRVGQDPRLCMALARSQAATMETAVRFHAITSMVGVHRRVVQLLRYCAARWGVPEPGGVGVPMRIGHQDLADMIGVRRPSVTTALGQLMRDGTLVRRRDRTWLLPADRPLAAGAGGGRSEHID